MTGEVRDAGAADYPAIFETVEAAFGRPDEARLVTALRRAGALTLDLVAEVTGASSAISPSRGFSRRGRRSPSPRSRSIPIISASASVMR